MIISLILIVYRFDLIKHFVIVIYLGTTSTGASEKTGTETSGERREEERREEKRREEESRHVKG